MAPNGVHPEDDDEIDYTDIENKYVHISGRNMAKLQLAVDTR